MSWLAVGLLGGVVGLDATSFPQMMISRPLVAGTLTGALFGRALEGMIVGLLIEVFSLTTLPIGAAQYPESGTAAVAATSAYLAVAPPGLAPGALVLAVIFALAWERVAGLTVVLHRRNNGQRLVGHGPLTADHLQRRHLAAMTLDFVRAAVVAGTGGVVGSALLAVLGRFWPLSPQVTLAVLGVAAAAMIGTALRLFGPGSLNRVGLTVGLLVGAAMGLLLS